MPLGLPHWLRPFLPARFRKPKPAVAVVRLSGAIGAVSTGIVVSLCSRAKQKETPLSTSRHGLHFERQAP